MGTMQAGANLTGFEEKLEDIKDPAGNWPGMECPSDACVEKVRDLLERAIIVPTNDGHVMIGLGFEEITVEVDRTGQVCGIGWDREGG